ncbi:MAG: hypothetical protein COV45_01160 [Deltaproteobacteria bacterium CG11_big_fil_rev_8_21_14_0_20_47_16]|nr:MAG: hypothetical protein COV45_01160 [Deltaproteobacteria bacterium CG11_big_fil_rev_8_21_14_0_20_47_16]
MTKKITIAISILLIWGGTIAALHAEDQPVGQKPTWNQKMKGLSDTISILLVDITSTERFNDPANKKEIDDAANKLAEQVKGINHATVSGALPPDMDPTIPILTDLFQTQTARAAKELKQGHRDYARSLLRSSTAFCIACHTRLQSPSMPALNIKTPKMKGLSKYERAELLVMLRNFDEASKEYASIAGDIKLASDTPNQWEKSVRNGLALDVRVLQNPNKSMDLVTRILDMQNIAPSVHAEANTWKQSIEEWQKEKVLSNQTYEALYIQAKHLMQEAHTTQKFPRDRSADVLYLRATTAIHRLLQMEPNGTHTKEALYWAGLAYDALQDLNLWPLHEHFYQACMKSAPHTVIAKSCYKEYEDSIEETYSGTIGTEVPSDVKADLKKWKRLAY